MIVAVTGGIGSGKSSVVGEFDKFSNVISYVADKEAKRLMNSSSTIRSKLIGAFGEAAYKNDRLNKAFLADLVFNNAEKLAEINAIVHPEVFHDFNRFVQNNPDKIILYESALVFETGSSELFDFVILVTAPQNTRIERVMLRDAITRGEVMRRIEKQWKEEKKELLSHYCIKNTDFEDSKLQIKKIHKILTEKS